MPRFAYLFVSLGISLSTVAACKSDNPSSCELPANAGNPECSMMMMMPGIDAAIDTPTACTGNTGCPRPAAPVCELAHGPGTCVECTTTDHALCVGTKPVCTSNSCEGCQSHSDCAASGVCLPSGACADVGDVAYVDAAGTDNTTCTKDLACTKIASALATQTLAGTPRPYLKIKGAISEAVSISRDVAMFAEVGATLTRSTNGAIVTISGTSKVEIDDLIITGSKGSADPGISTGDTTELTLKRVTVSQNRGNGVQCAGTSVTASRSTFSGNSLAGISAASGKVTVSSSIFTKNAGGGIYMNPATFDFTNNFIYDNGDKDNGLVGGALLTPVDATSSRFEFNTVVDNHAKDSLFAPAAGVVCDTMNFAAPNNLIVRNDIHGDAGRGNANVNTQGKCTYPTSGISASVLDLKFNSPDADPRDYHIQHGSSAVGTATTPTTVTTDFDGDVRTTAVNDQGADQLDVPI